MNAYHKPSRKEVFLEICSSIYESTIKYTSLFLASNSIIYFYPTLSRIINNSEGYVGTKASKLEEHIVEPLVTSLSIMSVGGQTIFYALNMTSPSLFEHNYWIIPLSTNALSGFYELGRSMYARAEKIVKEKKNRIT